MTTVDASPERFLVRIVGRDGSTAGVGMLVGTAQVVTCAHVVNTALGRDPHTPDQPTESVTVEFPLLSVPANTARVREWRPPPQPSVAGRPGTAGDDVAGLELVGDGLPAGAAPARLAVTPPRAGQEVRVFGYPDTAPDSAGAWVTSTVRERIGGGMLRLDPGVDAVLRVRPGYRGSPVVDAGSGRVIGLLAQAAPGRTAERDGYAIGTDRLRLAWPELLDPRAVTRTAERRDRLTVLHVSDPQFGRHHLFGGNGLTPADQAHDTLFTRLHADLAGLAGQHGLRPDLMVVTGDLAEWGLRTELEAAFRFVAELAEAVELPRHRVAVVPGNHDVNRKACEGYFATEEADERAPVPPYFPKWKQFVAAFREFYAGVAGVTFSPDEPWTVFEMPDLAVVVAGLNSTMAESHREDDHYGWLGEAQLRWFADRLAYFREQGWLRLAAVHHNAVRGAVRDDENLRDADDLDQILGQPSLGEPGLVNLLLHGHTHDGRLHRLPSGLVALSTGSAAVVPEARPTEVPNQYQLVTITAGGFTRHARQYAPGQHRWIGDTRISPTGSDWTDHQPYPITGTRSTFQSPEPSPTEDLFAPVGDRGDNEPAPGDDLLALVAEATRVSHPDATVAVRPGARYLLVTNPLPDGGGMDMWPVGVTDGPHLGEALDGFVARVHALFAAANPAVRSQVVYAGPPAPDRLVRAARERGVRLRSFVDYQGLLDLRPLVARQTAQLEVDRVYPPALYVPQRYRRVERRGTGEVRDGLAEQVADWLRTPEARFVMVLGDFGRGKTALLRHLARTLPTVLPDLLPILVELRSLEKAPSLDELLVQHLVRQEVEDLDLGKLRYMIRTGQLALLFDGFDELELRVGYDNAADYLATLLGSVTADTKAKVVLTSRTQHFRSTGQVSNALGERVAAVVRSRVVELADFSEEQIRIFLTTRYAGDTAAADARFTLLAEIEDLLGLARNPRMLEFIAALDEDRLREVQRREGRISAAELYRELVDVWLVGEAGRQRHRHGVPSLHQQERLAACTELATRLWASTGPTIPESDLSAAVSTTLTRLAERNYTTEQAAHSVGSGSLLVRTADGTFTFVHQSVMEWLVADAAARDLRDHGTSDLLGERELSQLMADFLYDLAGPGRASQWALTALNDSAASQVAKENALAVLQRTARWRGFAENEMRGALRWEGPHVTARPRATVLNLSGVDLRRRDLAELDLRGADLRGATLRGMRLEGIDLSGADLRDADLTGSRLVGGSLRGAHLSGSTWDRAVLLGVAGIETLAELPALAAAAIAGHDPAISQVAASGPTACLAFSPDGAFLAVGRAATVEIIDRADDRTVHTVHQLCGHTGWVTDVAYSPNGTQLATTSRDRTARIWDPTTGRCLATLIGHGDPVTAVAYSPDGTRLATTSKDGTTRIWNPTTGRTLTTLTGHTGPVTGVAYSPDGTQLATASGDKTIRLWQPRTGEHLTTLTGHIGPVTGVAYSPDGTQLATTSEEKTLILWETTYGRHLSTIAGHAGWLTAVAYSPDSTQLATASRDYGLGIWDTATRNGTIFTGHLSEVTDVAFAPDGTQLATTSRDQTVRIWGPAGRPLGTLTARTSAVTAVAFAAAGTRLASASGDTVRLWDVATGRHRTTLTGHTGAVAAVAFSPSGMLVATSARDRTARLWNAASGAHLRTFAGHANRVTGVAFLGGGLLATTCEDHTTRIFATDTGRVEATLTGHTASVAAVAVSPDRSLLATAAWDGTVGIWDAATGHPRGTLLGHSPVAAVAFSPDGAEIAAASGHRVRLWTAGTGVRRTTLRGHADRVTAIAYSPDGDRLATASRDHSVRLWEPGTGAHVSTLTGHTGAVTAVAYSPDGDRLATGSEDGTIRLWEPRSGTHLATLVGLPDDGYAVLLADGSYKLVGDPGDVLWWSVKLCRFAPGELDPYVPGLRRVPADLPIPGLAA